MSLRPLLLGVTVAVAFSSTVFAQPNENFADPTKANLLRQYNAAGQFVVDTIDDSGLDRPYANDGSGQIAFDNSFGTGSNIAQQTFVLPAPVTVGSYRVQFEFSGVSPASFEIQGRLGNVGAFTPLATITPAGVAEQVGSFTATQVDHLRYVATPPSANNQFFLSEMQVFAAAPTAKYGTIDPLGTPLVAMNLMRDSGLVNATHTSADGIVAGFVGPGGGNASTLIDGSHRHNDHFAVNRDTGSRMFVAYDLDPTQLNLVHLGANRDQGSSLPVQIWTSNLANPDEYNDADWTLQVASPLSGSGSLPELAGSNGTRFTFAQPGVWEHLRVTFTDQVGGDNYGVVELEAYGFVVVPEPAALSLLGIGAIVLLNRVSRNIRRR